MLGVSPEAVSTSVETVFLLRMCAGIDTFFIYDKVSRRSFDFLIRCRLSNVRRDSTPQERPGPG